jgi:5-methyltetrahydropteroyltriglutamate--homocysteine methyltransferase
MITTNNGGFPWRGLPGADELARAMGAGEHDATARETARELHDRVGRAAIEAQLAAGCDLVTDGLARRSDPMSDLVAGIGGLEPGPLRDGFPGGGGTYQVPVVRQEVAWTAPILGENYLFGARGIEGRLKVVLTGPYTIAVLAEDHAYGEPMALAMALATALNQELRSLQGAGVPWIQVDEPALLGRPEDFPTFTRIWEVLGRGVQQTRLALHLEGGPIGDLTAGAGRLKRLGCLSVDCVTAPENLAIVASASLPDHLALGLGLVSGQAPAVEDAAEIAARVRAATGLPPAQRLQVGTGTSLARLPVATAVAKLKALDAARRLLAPS